MAGPTDAIYGYILYLQDGFLGFAMRNDVNASPHAAIGTTDTTINLTDLQWHHVAVSVARTPASATGGALYVDGAAVATFSTLPFAGLSADNVRDLFIGASNPFRAPLRAYFEGDIDEVEIFNKALTQQDVLDLYTAGSTGKCTPTVGVSPTPTNTRVLVETPTGTPTRISNSSPSATPSPTPTCGAPGMVNISTGMQQPVGGSDLNWYLISAPQNTTGFTGPALSTVIMPNPGWTVLPNTQWISADTGCTPTFSSDCPGGEYVYELCWEQCGELMPSPLRILADNTASVSIDSIPVATNPSIIGITTPATIPGSALGSGYHSLRVDVHNNPASGGGGTATGMDLNGTLNGAVRLVRCRDLQPPTPTSTPTPSPTQTPTPPCPDPHSVIISTGTQPIGSTDTQWSLRSAPVNTTNFSPGVAKVISPNAAWSSLPTAEWISASQLCSNIVTTDCPAGNYTYDLCWQQCGVLVPEPLQILADNSATVFLDSVQVATTPATIGFATPATIPGFTLATGMHRLRVDVHNDPHNGDGTATGMDLSGTLNGSVQVFRCPTGFCVGDCNGDDTVTIDDLLKMVNVALNNAEAATCASGDANQDGSVTIEELVAAVGYALNGCPAEA